MIVLYSIFRFIFLCIFKLFNRMEVRGAENLPETGPVVLVSNHISNWDPMVVGSSVHRKVHFIAKEELFKAPLIGLLIKAWGAMPVKRGRGDREAISKSLEVLREQKVLGIFIEGTRNKTNPDRMQKPQPGAAMLAIKSGAPVVPMVVKNTRFVFRFAKIKVAIGEPIFFTDDARQERKELYHYVSQRIVTEIEKLR
jgi:1-acyl-sn-glycerol-3-phosphate acyltransferase